MATQTDRLNAFRVAWSKLRGCLLRNNNAQAWVGEVSRRGGDVVLRNARPLHAGLGPGTSDLIGWTPVTITPDMVGCTIAVFTAVEEKSAKDRATQQQRDFVDTVRRAGGIGVIAYSVADAEQAIANFAISRQDDAA